MSQGNGHTNEVASQDEVSSPPEYTPLPPGYLEQMELLQGKLNQVMEKSRRLKRQLRQQENKNAIRQTLQEELTAQKDTKKARINPKTFTFQKYNGKKDPKSLLAWLNQFDEYYYEEKYSEHDKIKLAVNHLSESASLWWNVIRTSDDRPSTWEDLKNLIKANFLPVQYKERILQSWDVIRQTEHENVTEFVEKFWQILLQAQTVHVITEEEQKRKFIAALKFKLRAEVTLFSPEKLNHAIDLALTCEKKNSDRPPRKGPSTFVFGRKKSSYNRKNRGKFFAQSRLKNNQTETGSRPATTDSHKASSNGNKGKITVRCFKCKKIGHYASNCPEGKKMEKVKVNNLTTKEDSEVPRDNTPSGIPHKNSLLQMRGCIQNKFVRILHDDGSSHDFISSTLVERLKLKTSCMEFLIGSSINPSTTKGTLIVKKLPISIRDFKDKRDFLVAPLKGVDIILGMPWRHQYNPQIDYSTHIVTVQVDQRTFTLKGHEKNDIQPLLSHTQVKRAFRKEGKIFLVLINSISMGKKQTTRELKEFIQQFSDCFMDELPPGLPMKRPEDHKVEILPGNVPPCKAPYRVTLQERQEIQKQIDDLIARQLIKPSSSPYGAPVLLVKKKDGTFRMCVDYRALNKITVKNRYPIPRVDDLLDKLKEAQVFSKIDLKSGYHQVRVIEADTYKTAFRTQTGHYEFRVMPFGLTNAPATFCRMMNIIFLKHQDHIIVFFDDLLVFSKTEEEHRRHLQLVFDLLRQNQLYINPSKSAFFQDTIEYLGHIVSKEGIQVDPKKVQSIMEWPQPKDVHDLRSFLGLCSYYRKFVQNFAAIANPLTLLLKKGTSFKWSDLQQQAFDKLKQQLTNAPVLQVPDFSRPFFVVVTDASGKGFGAVLMQDEHPIAYESRSLKPAEVNYSTYDKELSAVVHALKIWRHYLMGSEFLIKTDQQSIRHLLTQPLISERHIKWASFIQSFQPMIQYQPDKENVVADALSRRPSLNNISSISIDPFHAMRDGYQEDLDFSEDFNRLQVNQWKPESHFSYNNGFMFYDGRLCVTRPFRKSIVEEMHQPPFVGHRGVSSTYQMIAKEFHWPNLKRDVAQFIANCLECQKVKAYKGKTLGLLKPLPIPSKSWEQISMDFITGFPKTQAQNDMIWTIVDRFSKQAYFLPCKKTMSSQQAALMFIKQVFTHHGLPKVIVSDRDSKFCSNFWTSLFENLGTKLDFSSAFHPESNGQTEVTNSTILDMLRCYVQGQANSWDKYIHLLQFAYNNTPHSAIGRAPFEVVYGKLLPVPITRIMQKVEAADQLIRDYDQIIDQVKKAIEVAQEKYAKQANKKRLSVVFKEGDLVLLKIDKRRLKSVELNPVVKIAPRFYGPFKILYKINDVAYRLELPSHWRIHNSFHISMLKPYKGVVPNHPAYEEAPDLVDTEEILVPEKILDHNEFTTRRGQTYRKYLVKYKNHPVEDSQWKPDKFFREYPEILDLFSQSLPTREEE